MRQLSASPRPRSVVLVQTGIMVLMAVLAVALACLPIAPASSLHWVPSFPLILLFYWTVHRPDAFPRWLVFLMGLTQDVLSNGPLGLWALVYVCTYEGVYINRLFFIGRVAYSSVVGFAMAAGSAALFAWMLLAVYDWRVPAFLPVLGQTMVTILVYPAAAWILDRLNRWFGAEYD